MKFMDLIAQRPSAGTDKVDVPIPSSLGQGSLVTRYYDSGIRLMVSDFKFNQPTTVKTMNPQQCYGFGFFLSGKLEARPPCFKNAFVIQGGQSGFFSFPEMEYYTEIFAPGPVLRFTVCLSPDLLSRIAGKHPEQLPPILRGDPRAPYRVADKITPSMRAVLGQITNCAYQGITRQLFMEGKVLELIAHKIAQLDIRNKNLPPKKKLTASEIERVRHAASLLTFDLEHPPTVSELSGIIGMCRSRLFACFQEVFGITPFGYLHQKRMEKAGHLLRSGDINVTQAAYGVGYSSLSHFTKAFKKYFGMPPSKCLQSQGLRKRQFR